MRVQMKPVTDYHGHYEASKLIAAVYDIDTLSLIGLLNSVTSVVLYRPTPSSIILDLLRVAVVLHYNETYVSRPS